MLQTSVNNEGIKNVHEFEKGIIWNAAKILAGKTEVYHENLSQDVRYHNEVANLGLPTTQQGFYLL
jgi:hypothetical protein